MYPKRGFGTVDMLGFSVVNVERLGIFAPGSVVTTESLKERGLVKGNAPVKVLGNGELKVGLTVKARAFSASAKSKIEKAGGKTEVV
jgi:large subunit ribosomal protein L15